MRRLLTALAALLPALATIIVVGAASPAHAAISLQQFHANHPAGSSVDYDGVYGAQCVDLIKAYVHEVHGLNPGAWGNAVDYRDGGTGGNNLKAAGFSWSTDTNFADGDILVWGDGTATGPEGHVAIWYAGHLYQQNAPAGAPISDSGGFFSNAFLGKWRKGPSGPPANGDFVSYGGHVYRIAGGAPVYVSSWTPFGGAQPTRALSDAEFAALATVPANGTFISGQSSGRVYRVAGGAPIYVTSWAAFGGAQPTIPVDDAAISNAGGAAPYNHINRVPSNIFLRGTAEGRVYRVVGGHPYWVSSWDPYGGVQTYVDVDQASIDACDHLDCSPFGSLDVVSSTPLRIRVAGWAMDPNSGSSISVHVYIDSASQAIAADGSRPDVDNAYHRGANFGYDANLPATAGTHQVCTYAINVGIGGNVQLGCKSVTVAADTAAPTVTPKALSLFRLTSDATYSWSASDASASGVKSYDVRYRSAFFDGGFGEFVRPSNWQGITRTSVSKTDLARARTYCFSTRARDNAGNLSAWSAEKCTTQAIDDRALTRGTGWAAKTDTAFYDGTYFSSSTLDSALSKENAQIARVGLVATTCPTCGVVGVYVGDTLVGKANLYAATTTRKQIVALPKFSVATGTVTLKVLSSGKTVQVDGLALTRV